MPGQLPDGGFAVPALDPEVVRDTIARVFTHPGYDQSLRQSLGDRLLNWVIMNVMAFLDAIRGSANLRWVIIGLAIGIVAVILGRAAFLASVQARSRTAFRVRRARHGVDPWAAAAELAAAGSFMEAAHLLYAATLEAIARSDRIALHPARTIGEYQRDLRSRGAATLPAFTAFARKYEHAMWGRGALGFAEYEQLQQLAAEVVLPERQRLAA
jgi:hypothetical protein